MTMALWIINGLLAVTFVWASLPKLIWSKEKVTSIGQKGVADLTTTSMRAVGLLELLAAIGLIAPLLLSIAPVLTPLAAVGLIVIMIGAAILHVRRHETFVPNLVLVLVSAVSAALGFWAVLSS
jgi:uncharacterized membrane protein YphA (DoxX/SURF4 family)